MMYPKRLTPEQQSFLESLLSPHRLTRLRAILDFRLDDITIVLDNLFDPHNMGAIVRTTEGLGIQDIHVIEKCAALDLSRKVTKYSHKWVSINRHDTAIHCIEELKRHNFSVYAALLDPEAIPLTEIPVSPTSRTAVVVGNEHEGVSPEVSQLADYTFHIPMFGFTESFNVSVATSLILGNLVARKRACLPEGSGTLSDERRQYLYDQWLLKSVKNSQLMLKGFNQNTPS